MLKRTARLMFHSIGMLILALAVVVPAYADKVITRNTVQTFVNIRLSASSESQKIGELHPGDQLDYTDSVPRWHQLRLSNGQPGFVSKRWTEVIPAPANLSESSPFTVHFIDVGNGDAAIIDRGDREIIIDGGNSTRVLNEYLNEHDIIDGPIELVIVTHGDTDHWKGLRRVLGFDGVRDDPFSVLEYWDPGYDRDCNGVNDGGRQNYLAFVSDVEQVVPSEGFLRPLEDHHVPADVSGTPQPFTVDTLPGVTFTLLHSNKAPNTGSCSYKINNASIVLMIEIEGVRFLFTGDANGKIRTAMDPDVVPKYVEEKLLTLEQDHPGTLKADVLKVPHHGSETASTHEFIAAINPLFVIISASTRHHLPKPTTVARYASPSRLIFRTDDTRTSGIDHILCFTSGNVVDCNFADVFVD